MKGLERADRRVNGLLALGAVPYGNGVLQKTAITRGYSQSLLDLPASGPEVVDAVART